MSNFGKAEAEWRPKYSGFTTKSVYLTMRDGVKLAVDILLPKGLASDAKIPSLMLQTRYWRANNVRPPFKWLQKPSKDSEVFTGGGYALVLVDVRGTGASYGVWAYPWSREEVADGGDIVNWIIHQPWSNGMVGSIGTSYVGAAAEFLAVNKHPAVKAITPRFSPFDNYSAYIPGGVITEWFLKNWALMDSILDRNEAAGPVPLLSQVMEEADATLKLVEHPSGFHTFIDPGALRVGRMALNGVKPIDLDRDRRQLREAIMEHVKNGEVYDMVQGYVYRDDYVSTNVGKVSIDDFSTFTYRDDIEHSGVAINSWSGWFDGEFADDVIKRFLTLNNPQLAVIGPWGHGAMFNASPYKTVSAAVNPSVKGQFLECMRFFDDYLKGDDKGVATGKSLIYYTLGEEKWKQSPIWPPMGTTLERWFFNEDHNLSQSKPEADDASDSYVVDFNATTGKNNRWHSVLGGLAIIYPDRSAEDARLLTYTSSSLEKDFEITGYPVVNLQLSSTAPDGALHVYLEDVDSVGKVTYITEGELRVIHRKVSLDPPPYKMLVPYHSFKRKDAAPLVPGEMAEVSFGLNPTSVLIRGNHRIRVAIAGHDKDTFARIPSDVIPTITVGRGTLHSSFIDLPVTAYTG